MRLPRLMILGVLAVLLFSLPGWHTASVKGAAGPVSTVTISPSGTYQILHGTFTLNVTVNLASGESINGFDVRINYTNAYTQSNPSSVLQAESLNYAANIFAPYSTSVLVNCIDDIAAQGTNGCPSDDSPLPGQIHLVEGITGQTVSFSGLLFSIAFKVTGYGTSSFIIDRANLVNPHSDPSNPQAVDPAYIPVLTQDAVFGNSQANSVVPFFNFRPDDTSMTPSIIPNHQVDFDASPSFEWNNSSPGFWRYSWNFGDKTIQNKTIPTITHSFSLPGNYTVSLSIWDSKNQTGTVKRTVNVLPALGSLALIVQDQGGNVIASTVTVKLFNSTSFNTPFATQTANVRTGTVQFSNLAPSSSYYLTFSGAAVLNATKSESVSPGWTTQDRVYLQLRPPPVDYGPIVYVGSILAGLGVVTAAIVYKKRSSNNSSSRRATRTAASRVSRRS